MAPKRTGDGFERLDRSIACIGRTLLAGGAHLACHSNRRQHGVGNIPRLVVQTPARSRATDNESTLLALNPGTSPESKPMSPPLPSHRRLG